MPPTTKKSGAAPQGVGAAGGAIPGTNTTAAENADDAVVSTEGATASAVAPKSHDQSDATPLMETGSTPPVGGEIAARIGERPDDGLPGLRVGGFAVGAGEPVVTHMHVRALSDGFRRAGRAWPAAGVEVCILEFDDEQLERIVNEPMLVVTPIARLHAE